MAATPETLPPALVLIDDGTVTSPSIGFSAKYSRADHKHKIRAFLSLSDWLVLQVRSDGEFVLLPVRAT